MDDDAPAISATAEIERSLVAGLIFHPDHIPEIAAMVQPSHFGDFAARVLYTCLRDMAALGKPIDFILLREELKRRKEFEAVGGLAALNGLLHLTRSDENLAAYAGEIAKAAAANERLGAVANAYGDLVKEGTDSGAVCSDLVARLHQIDQGDLQKREAMTTRDILRECLDPGNRAALVETDYKSLDSVLGGGLAVPSLTVIGAAPSMGKTQLANNLAARMQKNGEPARVLYLSLEMGKAEMTCRFIAMLGGIDLGLVKNIQYGRASEYTERTHGDAFDRGAETFAKLPILMFTGSLDADGVREFAARYSGRYDVLILDYLQRVGGQRNQKALERVEAASRACKDIAVQHNVAVVALASLSREGYRDKSVKPDLAHLRECGTIEFDAANIWMLWRNKDDMPTRDVLELHVRKQRNGPLDTLNLDFDLHTGRISERQEAAFLTNSDDGGGFMLPALALACSRLRLDVGELIEAVLSGMDAGFSKREAVTMSIVEVLQRRGAYHGAVKRMIDDGTIFQIFEEKNAILSAPDDQPHSDISPARRNAATGRESGKNEAL